jgi:hypothetical protein
MIWQGEYCPNFDSQPTDAKQEREAIAAQFIETLGDTDWKLAALVRENAETIIDALRQPQTDAMQEPEAMRYGFDGFGYKYIDSGSGSDWRTRHPDAEPLYAQPQTDALKIAREALERIRDDEDIDAVWVAMSALAAIDDGEYFRQLMAEKQAALEQSK